MGIPKFYRWLSERYPLLNQKVTATEGPPDIDNLYLDMNGIIHNCTHANRSEVKNDEEAMMLKVFDYLDKLVQIIKPRKVLFMAIDGCAPRAKMNQQRARRFKSAEERKKMEEEKRQKGEAVSADPFDSNCITPGTAFMARLGKHLRFYIRKKMDEDPTWQAPTVIFSGHEVPGEGEHKIMEYIRLEKRSGNYAPNQRHCLYGLDADLIMLALVTHEPHFCLLREVVSYTGGNRGQPAREVLENPCAENFILFQIGLLREYLDLEFQALALPFPLDVERVIDDFVLFCMLIGNDFLPALPTLDINEGALNNLIDLYKGLLPQMGGYLTHAGDLDRGRLEALTGRLAELELRTLEERASDAEFMEQKRARGGRGGGGRGGFGGRGGGRRGVVSSGIVSNSHTSGAIGQGSTHGGSRGIAMAPSPADNGNLTSLSDPAYYANAEDALEDGAPADSSNAATELDSSGALLQPGKRLQLLGRVGLVGGDPLSPLLGATEDLEGLALEDEPVGASPQAPTMMSREARDLFTAGLGTQALQMWKERYYFEKLKLPRSGLHAAAGVRSVTEAYIEGLHWVLEYYYRGVASWNWYYPFHYAPMASEMTNLNSIKVKFIQGTPFRPFEQLLGVLPSASKKLLPEPFQWLMTDPSSKILDFYPLTFEVDMEGKRADWEAVVMVPFVDEERLLAAVRGVPESQLTAEERERNLPGEILVFSHTPGRTGETEYCASTMPQIFKDVLNAASRCIKRPSPPPLPTGQKGFVPKFSHGTTTGVLAPAGFPTLCTMQVTGSMRNVGVNILGMPSRRESLVVQVKDLRSSPSDAALTLDQIAPSLLGARAYVNWPYLQEAMIVRISDEHHMVYLGAGGAQTKQWSQQETSKWASEASILSNALLTKMGMDVGKVDLVVHVRSCVGFIRHLDGTIEKQYSKDEVAFPLQAVLRTKPGGPPAGAAGVDCDAPLAPQLEEGMHVLFLGKAHFGCSATLLPDLGSGLGKDSGVINAAKGASFRVGVIPAGESGDNALRTAKRVVRSHEVRYLPSGQVAHKLGISPRTLGRITGNVWMAEGDERDRFDVGVAVKCGSGKTGAATPMCVPGYSCPASEDGAGWMYSLALVKILEEYKAKHNWIWHALERSDGMGDLKLQQLLPGLSSDERKAKAVAVQKWLKSLALAKRPLVKTNVQLLTEEGVRALQAPSRPLAVIEYENVPPALLLPPYIPTSNLSDRVRLEIVGGTFELGDRVTSILESALPPFGLRGTVIGIYDDACEVLFDEEFAGGKDFGGRLAGKRGLYVQKEYLLNLTTPVTMPLNKADMPREAVGNACRTAGVAASPCAANGKLQDSIVVSAGSQQQQQQRRQRNEEPSGGHALMSTSPAALHAVLAAAEEGNSPCGVVPPLPSSGLLATAMRATGLAAPPGIRLTPGMAPPPGMQPAAIHAVAALAGGDMGNLLRQRLQQSAWAAERHQSHGSAEQPSPSPVAPEDQDALMRQVQHLHHQQHPQQPQHLQPQQFVQQQLPYAPAAHAQQPLQQHSHQSYTNTLLPPPQHYSQQYHYGHQPLPPPQQKPLLGPEHPHFQHGQVTAGLTWQQQEQMQQQGRQQGPLQSLAGRRQHIGHGQGPPGHASGPLANPSQQQRLQQPPGSSSRSARSRAPKFTREVRDPGEAPVAPGPAVALVSEQAAGSVQQGRTRKQSHASGKPIGEGVESASGSSLHSPAGPTVHLPSAFSGSAAMSSDMTSVGSGVSKAKEDPVLRGAAAAAVMAAPLNTLPPSSPGHAEDGHVKEAAQLSVAKALGQEPMGALQAMASPEEALTAVAEPFKGASDDAVRFADLSPAAAAVRGAQEAATPVPDTSAGAIAEVDEQLKEADSCTDSCAGAPHPKGVMAAASAAASAVMATASYLVAALNLSASDADEPEPLAAAHHELVAAQEQMDATAATSGEEAVSSQRSQEGTLTAIESGSEHSTAGDVKVAASSSMVSGEVKPNQALSPTSCPIRKAGVSSVGSEGSVSTSAALREATYSGDVVCGNTSIVSNRNDNSMLLADAADSLSTAVLADFAEGASLNIGPGMPEQYRELHAEALMDVRPMESSASAELTTFEMELLGEDSKCSSVDARGTTLMPRPAAGSVHYDSSPDVSRSAPGACADSAIATTDSETSDSALPRAPAPFRPSAFRTGGTAPSSPVPGSVGSRTPPRSVSPAPLPGSPAADSWLASGPTAPRLPRAQRESGERKPRSRRGSAVDVPAHTPPAAAGREQRSRRSSTADMPAHTPPSAEGRETRSRRSSAAGLPAHTPPAHEEKAKARRSSALGLPAHTPPSTGQPAASGGSGSAKSCPVSTVDLPLHTHPARDEKARSRRSSAMEVPAHTPPVKAPKSALRSDRWNTGSTTPGGGSSRAASPLRNDGLAPGLPLSRGASPARSGSSGGGASQPITVLQRRMERASGTPPGTPPRVSHVPVGGPASRGFTRVSDEGTLPRTSPVLMQIARRPDQDGTRGFSYGRGRGMSPASGGNATSTAPGAPAAALEAQEVVVLALQAPTAVNAAASTTHPAPPMATPFAALPSDFASGELAVPYVSLSNGCQGGSSALVGVTSGEEAGRHLLSALRNRSSFSGSFSAMLGSGLAGSSPAGVSNPGAALLQQLRSRSSFNAAGSLSPGQVLLQQLQRVSSSGGSSPMAQRCPSLAFPQPPNLPAGSSDHGPFGGPMSPYATPVPLQVGFGGSSLPFEAVASYGVPQQAPPVGYGTNLAVPSAQQMHQPGVHSPGAALPVLQPQFSAGFLPAQNTWPCGSTPPGM